MGLLHRMAHCQVVIDCVPVAAPDTASREVTSRDKVGDDRLSGPLSDADPLGDLSGAHVLVLSNADQDVPMVREERPRTRTG